MGPTSVAYCPIGASLFKLILGNVAEEATGFVVFYKRETLWCSPDGSCALWLVGFQHRPKHLRDGAAAGDPELPIETL